MIYAFIATALLGGVLGSWGFYVARTATGMFDFPVFAFYGFAVGTVVFLTSIVMLLVIFFFRSKDIELTSSKLIIFGAAALVVSIILLIILTMVGDTLDKSSTNGVTKEQNNSVGR